MPDDIDAAPAQHLAVVQEGPANLLAAIYQLAQNPTVKPETVAAWAAIQERMENREAERLFNEAFHRLAINLPRVKKNGEVEYKNKQGQLEKAFKFAKFEDITLIVGPLMRDEGFTASFDTAPRSQDGGGVIVTCTLLHTAGHKRTASIPVPLDTSGGKNNIQGYGSALSYGKRYTLTAILNLVFEGEDDDAQRGGMKFISETDAFELRELCTQAGRSEPAFLERLFAGKIRSFEEIEQGSGFLAARSTLIAMIDQARQRQAKGDQ